MSDDEIDHLSVEDLLDVASGVMREVAVRDPGLLAGAAARPAITVVGDGACPAFSDNAAALLHSLVRTHALVDGNKRLAWSATRVFCLINGRDLTYSVDEGEELIAAAAAGQLDGAGHLRVAGSEAAVRVLAPRRARACRRRGPPGRTASGGDLSGPACQ